VISMSIPQGEVPARSPTTSRISRATSRRRSSGGEMLTATRSGGRPRRRHPSLFGVVPAQQRFEAVHLAGAQADLRLVVEHELLLLERAAQALLHGHAVRQL